MAERRSIARTALLVLPAQVGFRALEASLPLLYAYWFGRNDRTDIYYFAWAVFGLAGSLIFAIHQDSALIPILAEEKLERPDALARLRGTILAHTWFFGGGLSVFIGLGALAWFRIRYGEGDAFVTAARMVPAFCIYLVAMSTRTFFSTLCVVEKRFFIQPIASFIGMLLNVGVLASMHASVGIAVVPTASVLGEVLSALVLAAFAIGRLGLKMHLCFDRPAALVTFFKLASSEVGGGAVTRLNPVVDLFMAGFTRESGAGTMLRNSGDVALLPTSLVQAALLPVFISHLAEDYAAKKYEVIRKTVVKALWSVGGILVAISALLYAVRLPLLRFIFLHGKMDAAGVERMAAIMPYHLVGLAPFGALLVLARAHVATKNGRIMISMGILNAICNVVFDLLFLKLLGLEGIALSTSAVHTAIAIVFWFRFEARLRELQTGKAA
jgi:putative peptidoglycan lipid II flippase